jgi:hypothetical protein
MRHVRSLGFDDLEARKLLTTVHHAAVHAITKPASPPKEVAGPLALDGSLAVNNRSAWVSTDQFGDQTTATPVSGVLGGLGVVRGTWDESVDQNGAYLNPDTIRLHNSKGSFVIAFDATAFGQSPNGASQHLEGGTGAYARASESGFVQLNTNPKETVVESLTVSSS